MILLILSIVALILFILVGIFYTKDDVTDDTFSIVGGICMGVFLISAVFIVAGYTCKPDLDRKHELEILLVNDCNANTISKAEKYNKDVNKYNNYWCRFSIENRSEYYIDIDSFLEKEIKE